MQTNETRMTPQQHAQHIALLLRQAQQECRVDIDRVNDPKAQALFETVAEVLGGTMKALTDYQQGTEPAWRHDEGTTHPREFGPPDLSDMRVDVDRAAPPPHLTDEMPP